MDDLEDVKVLTLGNYLTKPLVIYHPLEAYVNGVKTRPPPYPFIDYNTRNYFCGYNIVFDKSKKLVFFIEGEETNNQPIVIKSLSSTSIYQEIFTQSPMVLENIPLARYKVSYKNWSRTIDLNESMVAGSISGSVNLKSCGINENNAIIECYRDYDKIFIGRYPIINGTYNIPNLDCNTRYNLILVDETRTIEQKVLSYRKPTAYKEDSNPSIVTDFKALISSNKILLSWFIDQSVSFTNFDHFNLYASTEEFTIDDIKNKKEGIEQNKIIGFRYDFNISTNYKYFLLESVYGTKNRFFEILIVNDFTQPVINISGDYNV